MMTGLEVLVKELKQLKHVGMTLWEVVLEENVNRLLHGVTFAPVGRIGLCAFVFVNALDVVMPCGRIV